MIVNKKVNLKLVGLDGNAFSLMAAFRTQAEKEGWAKDDIYKVLDEAQSGDYDHLLCTLMDHCSSGPITGVYETEYGNACEYYEGEDTAYDLDMREEIPIDLVNFKRFIREID